MSLVVAAAETLGATRLVEVTMAHIGSAFYTGRPTVDFAEFLLAENATFAVPTMSNVGLVDLDHPELRPEREAPDEVVGARRAMEIYRRLGCEPVWTCAPYQQLPRPGFGEHIVGSESNAVVFYNSAIGARTNKYGDFLDVACAITGRAPAARLHTDEGRWATLVLDCDPLADYLERSDLTHQLLGLVVGTAAGSRVPVLTGVPALTDDQLKAIASAAAAAGGVEMFHAVGVTPEAPTLEAACGGPPPGPVHTVTPSMLADAAQRFAGTRDGPVGAVCLGTPHYSVDEFARLHRLLDSRPVHPAVSVVVSTSRAVRHEIGLRGWLSDLDAAGVRVVVDTCTYFAPRVSGVEGTVLTDSAKWTYYGRGLHDGPVGLVSTADCVESAVAGQVTLVDDLWGSLG